MVSILWTHLTGAATSAVATAANVFGLLPGNAPNKDGAHQMAGGRLLPDRPAQSKRVRANGEGGKHEQPRKKTKRRKSSAAEVEQMHASGPRTEVIKERHVFLEQHTERGREEFAEMTTDISKEASRPLYGQGSHAHALRERAKAAEWEAERAALRAKHLREEAELAEREERDEAGFQANVAAPQSSTRAAGLLAGDMVRACGPLHIIPNGSSGVKARFTGGLMTERSQEQRLKAKQDAGPSLLAASPGLQSGNLPGNFVRGRPERFACLGLEAPPNPLRPDPEAAPEEDGSLTSANGGASEPFTDLVAPEQSDGRRQYSLRSGATDRKGKAKVPWDVPSSSQNDSANEAGPSELPTKTLGTTLEYDDVRSRVKPAHDRCGHGPSRPVCVTDRRKPLFSYGAKLAHLSVQTRADLGRFHALLMDPPPTWHGEKNRKTSADKIVQRIRGMLGWLSAVAKRADVADVKLTDLVPSADEEGAELVEEFVNWLRAERATVDATLHANYQSLLHLAMYLYHKESKALPDQDKLPYNDVPVIAKLRSYSRMLRRKAKKAPKVADERAKLVAWPDVVKVLLKELRAECAGGYSNGAFRKNFTIAKSFQRYLIAALLAYCGDRQRTIRELEVGKTLVKEEDRWVIRLEPKDHKTGASGARRPKFPLPACVSADLDTYLHTWRKYLKPKHDCVFSMANGQKPLDASGLCHMFRDTVHRITGQKMNPQLMRVAMVTHFRGSGASDRELEALALLMGHSVEVQRDTYDRARSVDEKAAPALTMIGKAFEQLMA